MSQYHRRLKEDQILQREKARQKRVKNNRNLQVDIKLTFFEDILNAPHFDIHALWDKIEERKKSLVKYGYWTKQAEITDLGYERMIKYLLKKERKPD